ncbi:hypothetical protein OHS59_16235 [Streptomyces sp. NBC_00414]|uniref:hypothetical protein n=1 Tax=Streptomyces sp. NBC_00414 TaxID=2975739 RepID=UPI002E1BDC92
MKGGDEMAWCTTSDVLAYTEVTVTEAKVDMAQLLIEIFADTTEDASDLGIISTTNLRLLKAAVAYQAAWMNAHPDQFTNSDFEAFQQDGLSVDNRHANSMILAPMAKRCIDRLSWKRNRNTYIRPMGGGAANYVPNYLNTTNADLDDDRTDWRPIDL